MYLEQMSTVAWQFSPSEQNTHNVVASTPRMKSTIFQALKHAPTIVDTQYEGDINRFYPHVVTEPYNRVLVLGKG
jgi:hypothetical protein